MVPGRAKASKMGLLAAACGAACAFASAEGGNLDISSGGWIQYGRIVKSLDTAGEKHLEKGLQQAGAQVAAGYADGPLRIHAGLGVQMSHSLSPGYGSGGYAPMVSVPYVADADLEYAFLERSDLRLSLEAGLFPFDYAPESQNLGLYLLRGPVYPGLLTSGFETKYVLPIANTLGFRINNRIGAFEQDLLLAFEDEWPTYWDASPAYVAAYRFGSVFRIGGGFQLNHFLPVDAKITDPKDGNVTYKFPKAPGSHDSDSAFVPFRGIKLMADFAFDPKALLGGPGPFGPEDLKLYGEIAVLGLDRDRAHDDLYGPIAKRMPMMAGINLPAFGWLDRLGLELEYYGAPWVDDPSIFEHTRSSHLTPIPKRSALDTNTVRDNFKWSFYAAKTVAGHVRLSAQAASDHYRPGIFTGYGEAAPPKNEVPFFSPAEWYWVAKLAYFF
jgi:hypothetical protein